VRAFGDLSREQVLAHLGTARFGRSLVLEASTESTNDDARKAALSGVPDGHVIVADMQTRGRGSRGRSWVSPAGLDLYVSIVAHVPLPLEQLPPLTLALGLAVADTLDGFLPEGPRARVKWPNDVWLEEQKCAGILVESASQGEHTLPLVLGIGLNVNRREFPEGLDSQPTSLALARGADVSRSQVLASLLDHAERWVDRFVSLGPAPVIAALEARLALRGCLVSCDELHGVVEGVAPSGALRLRSAAGVREVLSGTLRPLRS
jgi:BirA family transcriptional regulator, biotin operon repressor / biotin---[acetyl-CoA-carboxylase] ligase